MKKEYGDLMSHLLRYKGRFSSEQEFRSFIADSARTFARDLRDFDSSISFNPEAINHEQVGKDQKHLKIGCE
jgi:hypothetical protein